jgi:hypothetical protein
MPQPALPPPVPPPVPPRPPNAEDRNPDPENPYRDAGDNPYRDAGDNPYATLRFGRVRDDEGLSIRTVFAFRYAPRTSTPGAGVIAALGWRGFGFGAGLYGARTTVELGDITLWVPVATTFYDFLEWGGYYRVRSSLELGAALASGTPSGSATGTTESAFHAALHAGVAASWPLGKSADVEGSLALGYASSLRARANNVDVIGMDGLLISAELGLRLR